MRVSPPLWQTAALIAIFGVTMGMVLVVRPGTAAQLRAADDLLQAVGPLLVLPFAFSGLPALWRRRRTLAWSPLCFALAMLCFTAGQLVWTYDEVLRGRLTPIPSGADVAYLLVYPCLLLGILTLHDAPRRATVRARDVLDSLIVMTTALTFGWYVVLAPAVLQDGAALPGRLMGLAYPLGDLVILACILWLLVYPGRRALRGPIALAVAGMAIVATADGAFLYQTVHGGYVTGGLLDLGWPLGIMVLALSAQALVGVLERQPAGDASDTADPGPLPLWRALLPYVLLPFDTALIFWVWFSPRGGARDEGVAVGAIALVALAITRQVLAILENHRLHAAAALYARRLESANALLEALATTDILTDLPNHRGLLTVLDRELERARRYARPLALLFIDLDYFKSINDVYGHAAGDATLDEFARVTRMTLRAVDIVGRWGGEEFLAVLPESSAHEALAAAERVRAAIARHAFALGGGIHLTCCIGVACFPDDATDRDVLITRADQALYSAKQLGRNQIRAAGEPQIAGQPEEPRESPALSGTVEALAAIVARRQGSLAGSDEIAAVVVDLALALGLSPTEAHMLALVGRLHDIGQVAIPDAILQKPGSLADDEWAVLRSHPEVGADIVTRVPELRALGPLIRSHHERWDGLGYPDGLAGAAIPLGARILAVADAFVALTSPRPYRPAGSPEAGLALIRAAAGSQFDPAVVAALERALAAERPATGDQRVLAPASN